MLKKILIVLAVVILGLVGYVASKPGDYLISRGVEIAASPSAIFPHINNSKKCNHWMPWKDSDPGVQMQYSGPEAGVGSINSWDSKGQMGTGKAEVIESIPNKSVKTQLTYEKPMQMNQVSEITLTPNGKNTLVTWSVSGKNSFMGRFFCLFMNMEKMVGGEFEKGLGNLKRIVEAKK